MTPIDTEKMSTPEAMAPVNVTVIGGTGDGGVRQTQVLAVTPQGQANVLVTVVTPVVAIIIRFINLFLTVLVGLLVAAMTPAGAKVLGAGDFVQLVGTCASLSIPAAGLGFLKDLITVFGKLEGKFPLLTGSV